MNKLIGFLWKYNYFLLFAFLFIFSTRLIVKNNQFQHTSFFTRYYEISGRYNSFKTNFYNYLSLDDVNQQLMKENAYLRENNISALIRRDKGFVFIQDSVYQQKYIFIPALVTKTTTNLANNYLIINQGSKQGIAPEMGVISSDGIVGIVQQVSENFSSVLTVLNTKRHDLAAIKQTNYQGRLDWDPTYNYDYLGLSDIAIHAEVNAGDSVTTGNASWLYPKNTPIGIISEVDKKPGEIYCKIKIKTFVDFKKINHVYVVNNLFKNEERDIEEKTVQSLNNPK